MLGNEPTASIDPRVHVHYNSLHASRLRPPTVWKSAVETLQMPQVALQQFCLTMVVP